MTQCTPQHKGHPPPPLLVPQTPVVPLQSLTGPTTPTEPRFQRAAPAHWLLQDHGPGTLQTQTQRSAKLSLPPVPARAQLCLALCDHMDGSSCQAPLSMGFSSQENWSGLPFPSPGDLPNPGIQPAMTVASPSMTGRCHNWSSVATDSTKASRVFGLLTSVFSRVQFRTIPEVFTEQGSSVSGTVLEAGDLKEQNY